MLNTYINEYNYVTANFRPTGEYLNIDLREIER
jgi:hypothetical protein